MYKNDKNYLIVWRDSVFNKEFKLEFKGSNVRHVLRQLNSLNTTKIINVEEIAENEH